MATIFIHDTGKYTTTSSSGETGTTNIANNGIEFPLKIRNIKFGISANFDDSPASGSYELPKIGYTGFVSPLITLTGHIKKDATTSSANSTIYQISGGAPTLYDDTGATFTDEVKMLGLLISCVRTKGYKQLYYKDTTADNIFMGLSIDSTFVSTETSGTYKCFNVRVKSVDLTEVPDSKLIIWNATLILTK